MPIYLETGVVFRCKCAQCGHDWHALIKPGRCEKCRSRLWNGEGRSKRNRFERSAAMSESQTGKPISARKGSGGDQRPG